MLPYVVPIIRSKHKVLPYRYYIMLSKRGQDNILARAESHFIMLCATSTSMQRLSEGFYKLARVESHLIMLCTNSQSTQKLSEGCYNSILFGLLCKKDLRGLIHEANIFEP